MYKYYLDALRLQTVKVLSQYLPGGTEKNHENLVQYSWVLDSFSNLGHSEYETGVIPK